MKNNNDNKNEEAVVQFYYPTQVMQPVVLACWTPLLTNILFWQIFACPLDN